MMKRLALVILTATLVAACASSDDEVGRRPRRPTAQAAGLLGLLPPPNWWRDPQISVAVRPTDPQVTALDKIAGDHASKVDQLRMDAQSAERDLRLLLTAEHPTANDIATAGERVRTLRDEMLEHEVRMLADERALLTREQWSALQDQLREERQDFGRQRGGFGGRGGGGRGRGPGGRWPGM